MPLDTSAATTANNALASLPFGAMIGGPLKACVEAQATAAQATWKFIQEVGLNTDESGQKSAVNVSFQFIKEGKMAQLNIPLLTIVPIPYIAIRDIDINFKAKIDASASSVSTTHDESSGGGSVDSKLRFGWFGSADIKANYSSKKDSTATQDSKYSVEYTMDVAVKAGQDSMPAGLSKILDILGNSLTLGTPGGLLDANQKAFKATSENTTATLLLSFQTPEGINLPDKIQLADNAPFEGENPAFKDEGVQNDKRVITCDFSKIAGESPKTVKLKFKADVNGISKELEVSFEK